MPNHLLDRRRKEEKKRDLESYLQKKCNPTYPVCERTGPEVEAESEAVLESISIFQENMKDVSANDAAAADDDDSDVGI